MSDSSKPLRELFEERPSSEHEQFDHIVECGIEISSGVVSIFGPIDYIGDHIKTSLDKGYYGALVCFSNLNIIDEMGIEGNDAYTILLWKENILLPKLILKQFKI